MLTPLIRPDSPRQVLTCFWSASAEIQGWYGSQFEPPSAELDEPNADLGRPLGSSVRVLITGRPGFERTVRFAIDEDPAVIRAHVRATLEAE